MYHAFGEEERTYSGLTECWKIMDNSEKKKSAARELSGGKES